MDQKWIVQVSLNDECLISRGWIKALSILKYKSSYFRKCSTYINPISSVSILSWLYYPNTSLFWVLSLYILNIFILLYCFPLFLNPFLPLILTFFYLIFYRRFLPIFIPTIHPTHLPGKKLTFEFAFLKYPIFDLFGPLVNFKFPSLSILLYTLC